MCRPVVFALALVLTAIWTLQVVSADNDNEHWKVNKVLRKETIVRYVTSTITLKEPHETNIKDSYVGDIHDRDNNHEYHWWDVLTENLYNFFGGSDNDNLDSILQHAGENFRDNAQKVGEHVDSVGRELHSNIKNAVDNDPMVTQIKDKAHVWIRDAKYNADEYADAIAEDLARIDKSKSRLIRDIKYEAGEKASDIAGSVDYANKKVEGWFWRLKEQSKDNIMDAFDKVAYAGRVAKRWLWYTHEQTNDQVEGAIKRAKDDVDEHIKYARDSYESVQNRFREAANTLMNWPDMQFGKESDPDIVQYLKDLQKSTNDNINQIYAQLASKMYSSEETGWGRLNPKRPTLSAFYNSAMILLLACLTCGSWYECFASDVENDANHDSEDEAPEPASDSQDADGTTAHGSEDDDSPDHYIELPGIWAALIPITSILLTVMEMNRTSPWIINSLYICLISGLVISSCPSFLSGFGNRESMVSTSHNFFVYTASLAAIWCLTHIM